MNWEIIGDMLRITALAGLGLAGILTILLWKKNLATRVTYIRMVIQAVSFAALFYVFSYTIPLLYVLIIIFGITIVFGRLYCGWFCPFGFLMDLEVLLRKALNIGYRNIPDKLNKNLHQIRYVILLFFLFLPVGLWLTQPPPDFNFAVIMAQLLAGPFRPYSVLIDPMIPMIVPWTTGALVVFQINFTYPYVQEILTYAGQNIGQIIAIAFVGLTLVGSFFIRRFWCRFCPTGASLAVVNRFKGLKWAPMLHLEKDEEKCTKCGVCKRVCQLQVPDVYEQKGGKINTSMCMLCLRCAEMCPYQDTLKLSFGNKTLFKSRNWLEPSTNE
jgi:ferredoxin-type protein NapH